MLVMAEEESIQVRSYTEPITDRISKAQGTIVPALLLSVENLIRQHLLSHRRPAGLHQAH